LKGKGIYIANILTAVTPKLLAQGLLALRQVAIMPQLVNQGYSQLAGERGSSIDVPIPSAITAQAVAPGNTPPSTADVQPTSVSIALNNWYEAPFYLTDQDMMTAMEGTIPMQASEAIKSLAVQVNSDIFSLYKNIYGFSGTPGTTPFASNTTDVTTTRKILNTQLAPISDRRFMLDPSAEANALSLAAFQAYLNTDDTGVIKDGNLGRKLGFDFYMSQLVPTHTAGSITTGLTAKASTVQAVGTTAIVCTTAASTGACALVIGDIITFAGDTQTYVVTAAATQASAATDVTVNISPGKKVALAGGEAVTLKASHTVNLAFHRDAFAFATRPLTQAAEGLGNIIQSAVDPVSGLSLRLEISREHKRTRFSYDILYGMQCIRKELAARLAG